MVRPHRKRYDDDRDCCYHEEQKPSAFHRVPRVRRSMLAICRFNLRIYVLKLSSKFYAIIFALFIPNLPGCFYRQKRQRWSSVKRSGGSWCVNYSDTLNDSDLRIADKLPIIQRNFFLCGYVTNSDNNPYFLESVRRPCHEVRLPSSGHLFRIKRPFFFPRKEYG